MMTLQNQLTDMEVKAKKQKELLFEAFVEGFGCSGEGWNGEYPFADKGKRIDLNKDIKASFEDWMKRKEAEKRSDYERKVGHPVMIEDLDKI